MYMLDTNICIYLIKRKNPELARRIIDIPIEDIFVSSITVSELEYGVAKSTQIEKNHQSLLKFLSTVTVVDYDVLASKEYGLIRSDLEKRGEPIGQLDMLIAAHAKSRNAIIITNNEREFIKVTGLSVENWT